MPNNGGHGVPVEMATRGGGGTVDLRSLHNAMEELRLLLAGAAKKYDKAYRKNKARDLKEDDPSFPFWEKQTKLDKLLRAFYIHLSNAYNNYTDPAVFQRKVKLADETRKTAGEVMVEVLEMINTRTSSGSGIEFEYDSGDGQIITSRDEGAFLAYADMIKKDNDRRDTYIRDAFKFLGASTGFADRA